MLLTNESGVTGFDFGDGHWLGQLYGCTRIGTIRSNAPDLSARRSSQALRVIDPLVIRRELGALLRRVSLRQRCDVAVEVEDGQREEIRKSIRLRTVNYDQAVAGKRTIHPARSDADRANRVGWNGGRENAQGSCSRTDALLSTGEHAAKDGAQEEECFIATVGNRRP